MSFKSSLRIGEQGQKIVEEKLKEFGFLTKESNNKEVDLYFTSEGKEYTAEIKWDLYSGKSNNFAIETYNTKICKPSGIMATICLFWFHVDSSKKVYFARSLALREFIGKVRPKREITAAGDQNANLMLYSIDVICSQCFIELTKENLLQEIKNLGL
jgi:hypothetical protein